MHHRSATGSSPERWLARALLCALATFSLATGAALAQQPTPSATSPAPSPQAAPAAKGSPSVLPPEASRSHHTLGVGDRQLAYTAVAGTLPLLNGKG